ncbi:fumarylacetoacetate hydrolase family protein [Halobacillus naozhouensis]|uniref:Fumarylacetoacetate hydrolase family protein n=1 Tax=Halobacillus naozhouensis TaxID=554880 RepID=A0ABY8J0Y4_9BACI|nr:fumarylacetoacetate hydrolase family protein [Halobacillus naozhouensis]WFT75068.1 fumarylacetoacetate hydrolase family protein [Halobacillus naozhouensis]
MNQIGTIYCVGRNYVRHAKELNNEVPDSPLLFTKPLHSLAEANGADIYLPRERGVVHYEAELVIQIGKPYKKGISVDEIVDQMAIGIDFTLRDVQDNLKKKGHPWLLAKGFPNSAVLSHFIAFPGVEECQKRSFSLLLNGKQVQKGNIQNLIFDLQTLIDYCASHVGLHEGDVIFTGTPQGVGAVSNNDHFSLLWGEQDLGECTIKLS